MPHRPYTNRLLAVLDEKGVNATFHVETAGLQDRRQARAVQAAFEAGHVVGLRAPTRLDPRMSGMRAGDVATLLRTERQALQDATGVRAVFVRLPYGRVSWAQVWAVERSGFLVTAHNLDTMDYRRASQGQSSFVGYVDAQLGDVNVGKESVIMLQQDTIKGSVDATADLIDRAKKRGFTFVTLDACVKVRLNQTPGTSLSRPAEAIKDDTEVEETDADVGENSGKDKDDGGGDQNAMNDDHTVIDDGQNGIDNIPNRISINHNGIDNV